MTVRSVRPRSFEPSRRARMPSLGGRGEVRNLALVLLASLAVSAFAVVAVLVTHALAAVA